MPPGTVVEVEGRLIRGGFSPPLFPHELSLVGTARSMSEIRPAR
jgi:hypothetical protein